MSIACRSVKNALSHLLGCPSGHMVQSNTMSDPFRYVSYVPASTSLGHAVRIVRGRAMIAVAAGASPEEALRLADDFPETEVQVFDSDTESFVVLSLSVASPPSYNVH